MQNRYNSLYLETTRNCNFSCKYCSTGSSEKKKFDDVPFKKIADKIILPAYELGTRFIDFSGGEFFVRKDYLEFLRLANELGFIIGVATNGSLLSEKMLGDIKKTVGNNLIFSLGINSFDDFNIETRGVKQTYVLDVIKKIEKFGFRINLSVTIGEYNKESFSETVQRINELKYPFNRIPFVPRSCDAFNLMITKDSLKKYFHPVLRKNFGGHVSFAPYFLPKEFYEHVSGQNLDEEQIPLNPSIGCWVGAYYAINPEGDVAPCPMFLDHVSAGNVYQTPLKEILFESEMFNKITDRRNLEGKCGNCKYTYTCGGCRVMAYYKSGNIYAEDPTCFIEDLSPEELEQAEKETIKSFKNYVRMAKFGNLYQYPSNNKNIK